MSSNYVGIRYIRKSCVNHCLHFVRCLPLYVLYLYRARNKVTQFSAPTHEQLQCY